MPHGFVHVHRDDHRERQRVVQAAHDLCVFLDARREVLIDSTRPVTTNMAIGDFSRPVALSCASEPNDVIVILIWW